VTRSLQYVPYQDYPVVAPLPEWNPNGPEAAHREAYTTL